MEKEIYIEKENELLIEVYAASTIEIKLIDGRAEIFGSELTLDDIYTFSPSITIYIPIFTWHGCSIYMSSSSENLNTFVTNETPMPMYLNTHACLEKLRILADENNKFGPKTMIVGDQNVGKSSLCKILLNYAVREGRRPIYVDVDSAQGHISIPGTIGSVTIENEISLYNGLIEEETPLVYSYGSISLKTNYNLYKNLVNKLGETVREKLSLDKKAASSGLVINTFGWVTGDGYKILQNIAQALEVDVILVLNDDKLYNNLNKDLPFTKVHFLPATNGIKSSGKQCRRNHRDNQIRSYFYGSLNHLENFTFDVPFEKLQIYHVVTSEDSFENKILHLELNNKYKKGILAVSVTDKVDDLINSPVKGFICLLNLNMEEKIATILSPQPAPLPNSLLLLTQQFMPSLNV